MGTYVEDYLESMYLLPSELKRNFDLMRELDKVRACVFYIPRSRSTRSNPSFSLRLPVQSSYPLLDELKESQKRT